MRSSRHRVWIRTAVRHLIARLHVIALSPTFTLPRAVTVCARRGPVSRTVSSPHTGAAPAVPVRSSDAAMLQDPAKEHVEVLHDRPGLCPECLDRYITARGGGKV